MLLLLLDFLFLITNWRWLLLMLFDFLFLTTNWCRRLLLLLLLLFDFLFFIANWFWLLLDFLLLIASCWCYFMILLTTCCCRWMLTTFTVLNKITLFFKKLSVYFFSLFFSTLFIFWTKLIKLVTIFTFIWSSWIRFIYFI